MRYVPAAYLALPGVVLPPAAPSRIQTRGVLLFADIAQFTTLMEQLTSAGLGGSEILRDQVAAYFNTVIRAVAAYDGSVLFFAGDAMMAYWRLSDPDAYDGAHDAAQMAQAVGCAQLIQSGSLDTTARGESPSGIKLHVRIGVAEGSVDFYTVGGHQGQFFLLYDGDAMQLVTLAESLGKPDQIVVCPTIADRSLVPARALQSGFSVISPDAPGIGKVRDTPPPLLGLSPQQLAPLLCHPLSIDPEEDWMAQLRDVSVVFVNVALRATTMPPEDQQLAVRQTAVDTVTQALARHGGAINKILRDDKGGLFSVLAIFGLPMLSFKDNSERAVLASLEIQQAFSDAGLYAGNVGVASGTAFCGAFGNEISAEYGVLGDAVNVAARLMQQARQDVWIDKITSQRLSTRIHIEALAAITVKGKAHPLQVFRPVLAKEREAVRDPGFVGRTRELEQLINFATASDDAPDDATDGQSVASSGCDSLTQPLSAAPRVMLVTGESGLGKSRLVQEFTRALGTKIRVVTGAAAFEERRSPYYVWRDILSSILQRLTGTRSRMDLRGDHSIESLVHSIGLPTDYAGLLLTIMPDLHLPVSERIQSLSPDARANSLSLLLAKLLIRAARGPKRLVVFLDNAGWLDNASFALLCQLIGTTARVHWILAMRALPQDSVESTVVLDSLVSAGGQYELIALRPLAAADCAAIIADVLGASLVEPELVAVVAHKAEGNPTHLVWIAEQMVSQKQIEVRHGRAGMSAAASEQQEEIARPWSIQSAAIERLDALPAGQQILLRFGSVVGRSFTSEQVEALLRHRQEVENAQHLTDYMSNPSHQVPSLRRAVVSSNASESARSSSSSLATLDTTTVRGMLNKLYLAGVIDISSRSFASNNLECSFVQESLRDAAYDTCLVSLRTDLHGALAEFLAERGDPAEVSPAMIARHFLRSRDKRKAVKHCMAAAMQAQRQNAAADGLYWYNKVLGLIDVSMLAGDASGMHFFMGTSGGLEVDEEQRHQQALALARRGQCFFALGDFESAARDFEDALGFLGMSLPHTPFAKVRKTLHWLWVHYRYTNKLKKAVRGQATEHATEQSLQSVYGEQMAALEAETAKRFFGKKRSRRLLQEPPSDDEVELLFQIFNMRRHLVTTNTNILDLIFNVQVLVQLTEQYGLPAIGAYGVMGLFGVMLNLPRVVGHYTDRCMSVLPRIKDRAVATEAHLFIGVMYIQARNWDEAVAFLGRGAKMAELDNDAFYARDILGSLAVAVGLRGEIQQMLEYALGQWDLYSRYRDVLAGTWGLLGIVRAHIFLGNADVIERHLQQLEEWQTKRIDIFHTNFQSHVEVHGLFALAHWILDRPDEALRAAGRCLQLMATKDPGIFNMTWTYFALSHVVFGALDRCPVGGSSEKPLLAMATTVDKELGRFVLTNQVGLPIHALHKGKISLRKNQLRAARRHFGRCLSLATEFAMPLDVASAHFWIMRTYDRSNPEWQRHGEESKKVFEQMRMVGWAEQVARQLQR